MAVNTVLETGIALVAIVAWAEVSYWVGNALSVVHLATFLRSADVCVTEFDIAFALKAVSLQSA